MMDPSEMRAPVVANRNQSLGDGLSAAQGPQMSPSLQAESERYGSQIPRQYRPSPTGNGMSAGMKQATCAGMYRNPNGQASDTYELARFTEPAAQ